MGFIGVYKALYSYTPTNEQELEIHEGDLLYLLEKADDGWWTVKKRVPGAASEEPQGIVPHNYIEAAKPEGSARALYSYEQQTDEELSFKEGQTFEVFATDGDWILVAKSPAECGFVPNNYISMGPTAAPAPQAVPQAVPQAAPQAAPVAPVAPALDEDIPPPKPQRPQKTGEDFDAPSRPSKSRGPSREMLDRDLPASPARPDRSPSVHSDQSSSKQVRFPVTDVGGRRRSAKTLVIAPQFITLINEDGGDHIQKWEVHHIRHYSSEKKHVFLELQHPRASLDLKADSQADSDKIVSMIGQMVGAGRGGGLQEVLDAAQTSGHKQGLIVLDFRAANGRELTVLEQETVFVLNDKDNDWWLVRNVAGREGLVPRKFVHIDKEPKSRGITEMFKGKKQKEKERGRERTREIEREHHTARKAAESLQRQKSHRSLGGGDKSLPDPRKMRLWVDRTGAFKVDAQLLGCSDGKVHLHKANGVKIAVPVNKLSATDIDYVEGITGVSMNDDKPLASRPSMRRSQSSATRGRHRSPTRDHTASNERHESWFSFFLESGIDPQNANRYARNFSRDNMDIDAMGDVSGSVLRTLGLKEGDILRVTKHVNEKLGRVQKPEGGLYSTPTGALQNNSGAEEQVWNSASSSTPAQPVQPQSTMQTQPTGALADLLGISQPAPAAALAPIATNPTGLNANPTSLNAAPTGLNGAPTGMQPMPTGLTAAPTGSLAPLQAQKTAEATVSSQQRQTQHQILRQQAELQKEQIRLLKEQQDQLRRQQNELLDIQKTGSQLQQLGPFATGVAQSSNFAPTAASVLAAPAPPQPRAFQPIATGFQTAPQSVSSTPLPNQQSGFATGQPTGTFPGMQSQPTGPFQPQTTAPFQSQTTGPFQSQTTGPFQPQTTGPFQPQRTGPFQTSFQTSVPTGPFQSQTTGPFQQQQQRTGPFQTSFQTGTTTGPFQSQTTGPFQPQPSAPTAAPTTFQSGLSSQPTGPFQAQPSGSFQTPTTFQSQSGAMQQFPSQATGPFQAQATGPFQAQATGPFQAQATGPFQAQPSGPFQAQATGPFQSQPALQRSGSIAQPPTSFGQTPTSFAQPANSFGQPAMFGQSSMPVQQQPTGPFSQPGLQQSLGSQATGPFSQAPTGTFNQAPANSFGAFAQPPQQQQPSAGVYGQQPFQTGFSQPNFSQPNFSQPNISQPNFSQPNFSQPGPTTSFGQPSQQPLNQVPLQNQATGFGFGNQPQQQPRANVNMASAANPFGF